MNLNKPYILEALDRLAVIYKAQTSDLSRLAGVWESALSGLAPDQIRAGVEAYIRSDARFFPKPGQIRLLAQSSGQRLAAVKVSSIDPDAPCSVCGTIPGQLPKSQRWGVVHDHEKHYAAQVSYAGLRTGPTREGKMLPMGSEGDTPWFDLKNGVEVKAGR